MLRAIDIPLLGNSKLVDIDVNANGGVCFIIRNERTISLVVNGDEWSSWNLDEMSHPRHVRWIDSERVVVWYVPTDDQPNGAVSAFSGINGQRLHVGEPRHIAGGQRVYFATYGEDQYLLAKENHVESNMVVAFDLQNNIIFGLNDILSRWDDDDPPVEVSACCITINDNLLLSFYPGGGLWLVNPFQKTLSRVPKTSHLLGISAIAERDGSVLMSFGNHLRGLNLTRFDPQSGNFAKVELMDGPEFVGLDLQIGFERTRLHGCGDGSLLIYNSKAAFSYF